MLNISTRIQIFIKRNYRQRLLYEMEDWKIKNKIFLTRYFVLKKMIDQWKYLMYNSDKKNRNLSQWIASVYVYFGMHSIWTLSKDILPNID